MTEGIFVSTIVAFVKLMSPLTAIAAIILFLRPKKFIDIEKKLSLQVGIKKSGRRTTQLLEKENLVLQQLLIQHNRVAGFFIFVFSVIVIVRLYLHVRL